MGAAAPGRQRFGRKARLKHRRDFLRLREKGERVVCGCLVGNWMRVPAGTVSRVGVITAGKLGDAVVRNRARRLLRESFRRHQDDLAVPVDLVLVARPSIVGKRLKEVEKDFLTLLRKTRLLRLGPGGSRA